MSSFILKSTALKNDCLTSGSLKSLLDGGFLRIYSGTVPATADAVATGAAELLKFTESDDGTTGLTFATPAVGGVISKNASEVWKGTAGATGTATFWRFTVGSDDGLGAAGGSDYRLQGTVGTSIADSLVLPSTSMTSGVTVHQLDAFQLSDENVA